MAWAGGALPSSLCWAVSLGMWMPQARQADTPATGAWLLSDCPASVLHLRAPGDGEGLDLIIDLKGAPGFVRRRLSPLETRFLHFHNAHGAAGSRDAGDVVLLACREGGGRELVCGLRFHALHGARECAAVLRVSPPGAGAGAAVGDGALVAAHAGRNRAADRTHTLPHGLPRPAARGAPTRAELHFGPAAGRGAAGRRPRPGGPGRGPGQRAGRHGRRRHRRRYPGERRARLRLGWGPESAVRPRPSGCAGVRGMFTACIPPPACCAAGVLLPSRVRRAGGPGGQGVGLGGGAAPAGSPVRAGPAVQPRHPVNGPVGAVELRQREGGQVGHSCILKHPWAGSFRRGSREFWYLDMRVEQVENGSG